MTFLNSHFAKILLASWNGSLKHVFVLKYWELNISLPPAVFTLKGKPYVRIISNLKNQSWQAFAHQSGGSTWKHFYWAPIIWPLEPSVWCSFFFYTWDGPCFKGYLDFFVLYFCKMEMMTFPRGFGLRTKRHRWSQSVRGEGIYQVLDHWSR